jgi:hypothetical protein
VTTTSTLGNRTVEFIGLIEEVYRQSRQHDMGEEVDRFDADTSCEPPFASAGFTYAKVTILRTTPVTHAPPTEESEVRLGGRAEAHKGYNIDRIRDENRLSIGRLRNGGTTYAGPAVIDLAYLLGENGGHLNVNGIAGMGAKSSFLLHVIDLLMRWAKRTGDPGDTVRTQLVPIIFNVKNFDLFFIDRWNQSAAAHHVTVSACKLRAVAFVNSFMSNPASTSTSHFAETGHGAAGQMGWLGRGPEARQLLQHLAEGAAGAWLTREAKSALQRLARR